MLSGTVIHAVGTFLLVSISALGMIIKIRTDGFIFKSNWPGLPLSQMNVIDLHVDNIISRSRECKLLELPSFHRVFSIFINQCSRESRY